MQPRIRKNKNIFGKKARIEVILALFTVMTLLIAGCAPKGVPEGFNEDVVISQAKEVVMLMSARDYEGVVGRFSEIMKEALPENSLEAAVDATMTKLGTFREYRSVAAGSGENPTIGKFAVVVIKASYENGEATYTISIDKDGKLTGLYLK